MTNPEQRARVEIDRLLGAAGWAVQDFKQANLPPRAEWHCGSSN